jgi:hypothetical protein
MAVTWFIPRGKDRLDPITDKAELLRRFEGQQRVTIATGITCAFLGDERNLREYLVAAEAVRVLKQSGHIVSFYLFDDSMDPLTPKQLKVAAEKNPVIVDKYQHFCGMPISEIPSPESGSPSWAEHFEKKLLRRLAKYDCYPTLESAGHLYGMGAYDPLVKTVLEREADVKRLLERDFPDYTPQALYYPICPACGHIKGTTLQHYSKHECVVACSNCHVSSTVPTPRLRGKLNWKLDCAARWRLFNVDVEPFTKAYLEPGAGAFWIARSICKEFFGGSEVNPLLIGLVKADAGLDPDGLGCMPPHTLRSIYAERWSKDVHLTRERLLLAASKPDTPGELSYLDKIKRHLPNLKVRSHELTSEEYSFLKQAEVFQKAVLRAEPEEYASAGLTILGLSDAVLWGIRMILRDAVYLRRQDTNYEHFDSALKFSGGELGPNKAAVHGAIREILAHRKGLPLRRLIYSVPIGDLEFLLYAIERTLDSRGAVMQLAHERLGGKAVPENGDIRVTRLT